jgi:hypothetical protein
MKRRKLFLLLTAFILTNIVGVHAQSIIYDATSPNKVLAFTAEQQGDEVYAIGNARTVTQLQIGLSMQGFSGTSDFVLRLYANDGTAGAPGSLLWQSGLFNNVPLSGSVQLVSFDVPNVTVPDVFTWTIQISDSNPVAVGLVGANPPSIGSSPAKTWFGGPGDWGQISNPQDIMVRVVAVPEPGISVLLCLCLGVLMLKHQFRQAS